MANQDQAQQVIFVGAGCTVNFINDKYPATVIEIVGHKKRRVKVQVDSTKVEGGVVIFAPNPKGEVYDFTIRRNGRWHVRGSGPGIYLTFGTRCLYWAPEV